MNVLSEISKIMTELSGVDQISPETHLQEDLALDSLQLVTLLVLIEERFNIVLAESDMNPFDLLTVSNTVNLVKKYIVGDCDDE